MPAMGQPDNPLTRTGIRSRPAVLLIAAALLLCLVFGSAFIALQRLRDLRGAAVEAPSNPLTDEQARRQVVEPARQFVQAGKLNRAKATYMLLSCRNKQDPPYQGAIYLDFDLPAPGETRRYFDQITSTMTARGWAEALPPSNHPGGRTLTKDGVTAVYYPNVDVTGRGVLQIYGECRNVTDHRADPTGWVDITDALRG